LSHFHVKKSCRYFVFYLYRNHPFYQFTFCFEKSSIDLCTIISYFNMFTIFTFAFWKASILSCIFFNLVIINFTIFALPFWEVCQTWCTVTSYFNILHIFTFPFREAFYSFVKFFLSYFTIFTCMLSDIFHIYVFCFRVVLYFPYSFQFVLLLMFACFHCNVFGFVLVAHIKNTFYFSWLQNIIRSARVS
jgi:hypothetical protein